MAYRSKDYVLEGLKALIWRQGREFHCHFILEDYMFCRRHQGKNAPNWAPALGTRKKRGRNHRDCYRWSIVGTLVVEDGKKGGSWAAEAG